MTAYELVTRCDGAIDKESMEKLLAEKNDVPLSVVQFFLDNRERFEDSTLTVDLEELIKWCEAEFDRVDSKIAKLNEYYKEVVEIHKATCTYKIEKSIHECDK